MQTTKIEDKIKAYDDEMIKSAGGLERETKGFEENKKALEMLADHISQLRMEQKRMAEEEERDALKRKNYEA